MNEGLKGLVASTGLLSKIFTSTFWFSFVIVKGLQTIKKTCRVIKLRLDAFKIYILIWDKIEQI